MVTYYIKFIFLVSISFEVANAITNGHRVTSHKRYVVYLLQAKSAPVQYSSWLCGGAIIHQSYILTSAACLLVGQNVYVISGYNKYVNAKDMEKDICIMTHRRRIIRYCSPKRFKADHINNKTQWNFGDIAVAKVDVPFDFNDHSYYNICSYPPAPIRANYVWKFYDAGREVISLGWGHQEYYRPDGNLIDLNEEYLRYSSGKISSRRQCKDTWQTKNILSSYGPHLQLFLVCVDRPGHLNEYGQREDKYDEDNIYIKCDEKPSVRSGNESVMVDCMSRVALRDGRKDINETTGGICQNDHGGPLVSWLGGIETVMGVATMSIITKDMRCRTPYLYTSTACFNRIISCYVEETEIGGARRAMHCNKILKEEAVVEDVQEWPVETDS